MQIFRRLDRPGSGEAVEWFGCEWVETRWSYAMLAYVIVGLVIMAECVLHHTLRE